MKDTAIVIGGGIIGMLTALELSSAGFKVTLLEKARPGQESSWAGGGILSPLYPWRYSKAVTALAKESQRCYPDFLAKLHHDTGIDPEYQQSGLLILDTDDLDQAETWSAQWQHRLELTEQNALHRLVPGLADSYQRALWFPEIGQVRNPRLVKALVKALEIHDVRVMEDCLVSGFESHDGQLKGVRTSGGSIATEHAVVAGGAWSAEILQSTGRRPDIEPVKGQMILFRGIPGFLEQIILSEDHYVIPRHDGRILAGSTLERTAFEKYTTEEAAKLLYQRAIALLHGLANFPIEHHWAGLRPGSHEGVPFIGPHPDIKGLYINAGHYRNGVVLGLASAGLVVDMLCGREYRIADVEAYQL